MEADFHLFLEWRLAGCAEKPDPVCLILPLSQVYNPFLFDQENPERSLLGRPQVKSEGLGVRMLPEAAGEDRRWVEWLGFRISFPPST